jgi:beta-glucanase (GH16 family)
MANCNSKFSGFRFLAFSLLLLLSLLSSGFSRPTKATNWNLTWSDEFDSPSPSGINLNKWTAEVGGSGWGNKELQFYTNDARNAFLNGKGSLVITALKQKLGQIDTCWYGECRYSSGRLITKKKFAQKYGKIEARAKIPFGRGIWPAIWMLGNDIDSVGWPACGEIDIMENIGSEPSVVHGTIHGPGYSGQNGLGGSYKLKEGERFSDEFHTFAVEWEPWEIRWFVDGKMYQRRAVADLPKEARWVFDHPFFIILNVAVGGNWPGAPEATTKFPQTMEVDYVRVYQRS